MTLKTVTLARPHPAIVGEMVPFLEELGMLVEQVTQISQLKHQITATTDAVVISLAVTSTIRASVERVLAEVMQLNPHVVLIFSSELPMSKKQKNLCYLLSKYFSKPCIASYDNQCLEVRNGRCLYICANDLTDASRRSQLTQLIRNW